MARAKMIDMRANDLLAIPAVPFTDTWRPVHHVDVVRSVHQAIEAHDQGIQSERYQVSADGLNLFSTITLAGEGRDRLTVGFRNSMAKRFALGVVGGHNVMVCSNMCFWGDFIEQRRHTSGLTLETLQEFMGEAVGRTLGNGQNMRDWFLKLHEVPMGEAELKTLTFDAMDQDILPPSRFGAFREAYREELADNPHPGMESLAHFHGAATRVLREQSLGAMQTRTLELNRLINQRLPKGGARIDRRLPLADRFMSA